MRILITGGSGFVGRNIGATLAASPHELIPLSRRTGLDLTDLASTARILRQLQPDVILNCAAQVGSLNFVSQQAAQVTDENMRMLLNLYRAAVESCPRACIINPVANCAFPGQLELYREESLWQGDLHSSVYSYGSTRRMMIVLSESYRAQHDLRSINLLVPNMYGPFDSTDPNKAHALNALASKVVRAKAEGIEALEVWGTGVAVREWLYAADFARVIALVLSRIASEDFRRPLNVAQQSGYSVLELVNRIAAAAGYTGKIVWDPSKPDGAPRKVMDASRFRAVFPNFKFTELTAGLTETLRYYTSIYPYDRGENGATDTFGGACEQQLIESR
jgi:GDP-L-fucose synthase